MLRKATLAAAAALLTIAPAFAIPPVPRAAGEFVIPMPDGSQKLLSSFRGKVVCLAFVYTTCPHCQHASQVLTKLYQEYGAKGFQPLAVAFNPMAKMLVPEFVSTNHVGFPVGAADQDQVLSFLGISMMERYVVPQLLWIDKKGQIRSQTPSMGDEKMLGEDYWRQMIESLLKEPAGAGAAHHAARHASGGR
jgi:peroxiredoxin